MIIDLGNQKKTKTVTHAVKKTVDSYPVGHEFSVFDLMKDSRAYLDSNIRPLDGTYLRIMRKLCREKVVCINRHKSLYKITGGNEVNDRH